MVRALYPGTFDPIHNGHIDIAARAARLFDELVIGIYDSSPKSLTFDTQTRLALARESLSHIPNVRVEPYQGLTVTYAKDIGATVMVRGLRAISDFEFEFQMALTNKKLAPEVEFISLMTSLKYAYLSSSILKEVAMLGGDVDSLAPAPVIAALRARFAGLGPDGAGSVPIRTSRD
ncbi:MAG: pantetheine-phosphate adenylyltransferase [Anaerolineae bacterium]|jgi:pantetheine-phosphate adenylyltransferase|nr:pantetheine-phosphate adenylyltransferase [Anaerolineae bacterium]